MQIRAHVGAGSHEWKWISFSITFVSFPAEADLIGRR